MAAPRLIPLTSAAVIAERLDAPVAGRVDWGNFNTTERQRAGLMWIHEILRLIVERNGDLAIIALVQHYLGDMNPELWPDTTGCFEATAFKLYVAESMHNHHSSSDRAIWHLLDELSMVWTDNSFRGNIAEAVVRLRNNAPSWQVDRDELEAFAAVLLT